METKHSLTSLSAGRLERYLPCCVTDKPKPVKMLHLRTEGAIILYDQPCLEPISFVCPSRDLVFCGRGSLEVTYPELCSLIRSPLLTLQFSALPPSLY